MRYYFDHASTSPLRPSAANAMKQALAEVSQWGDPSRMHSEALLARGRLEQSRQRVAEFFGTKPRSVIFTSGATESIATAVAHGANATTHRANARVHEADTHQVASAVEHSAVLKNLEAHDWTQVKVDSKGLVDVGELMAAVTPKTSMVHLQMANHEVGTIQKVREVAALCQERTPRVALHVDAAQAGGHIDIAFDELGCDLMSISSHKLGGPQGVGALLVKRGVRLKPLWEGGNQERARRGGMENILASIGFAAACAELANTEQSVDQSAEQLVGQTVGASGEQTGRQTQKSCRKLLAESEKQHQLTSRIADQLNGLSGVELLGHPHDRLPHIVCLYLEDVEPQAVVLELDRLGFAVHSGSACSSEDWEPSSVLSAMGREGSNSLRISVGWSTTDTDVDALLLTLPEILQNLKALKP